ncbi:unnamed protein product [Mytilus coruscus]|uniref:Uncharacterized protein n=1 Tax=Mytilus coruscus TaxID=42192 RepID=A0A6J8BEM0_MYTCO|nr:unnamed protein product [Mytilus coruscus]
MPKTQKSVVRTAEKIISDYLKEKDGDLKTLEELNEKEPTVLNSLLRKFCGEIRKSDAYKSMSTISFGLQKHFIQSRNLNIKFDFKLGRRTDRTEGDFEPETEIRRPEKNRRRGENLADFDHSGGRMYELPGDVNCPVVTFTKYMSKLNPLNSIFGRDRSLRPEFRQPMIYGMIMFPMPNDVNYVELPDFLSDDETIASDLKDITSFETRQVPVENNYQTVTNAPTCNLNTFQIPAGFQSLSGFAISSINNWNTDFGNRFKMLNQGNIIFKEGSNRKCLLENTYTKATTLYEQDLTPVIKEWNCQQIQRFSS